MIPVPFHPNPSSLLHSLLFLDQQGLSSWAIKKENGNMCYLLIMVISLPAFTDLCLSLPANFDSGEEERLSTVYFGNIALRMRISCLYHFIIFYWACWRIEKKNVYLLLVIPVMAEYYRHSADLRILEERQGHHPLRKECPGQGAIIIINIHPFINIKSPPATWFPGEMTLLS